MNVLILCGLVVSSVIAAFVAVWKKNLAKGILFGLSLFLVWTGLIIVGLILGGDH